MERIKAVRNVNGFPVISIYFPCKGRAFGNNRSFEKSESEKSRAEPGKNKVKMLECTPYTAKRIIFVGGNKKRDA